MKQLIRDNERIERGMKNTFNFYNEYTYPCIDTTDLRPDEVAERIKAHMRNRIGR